MALTAGGALLAVVALELLLQIAALFFGDRAGPAGDTDADVTVLCLGDSHTYGVHVSEEEAYPGKLQSILDERAPGLFRVVNLGLPGMNSSQILSRLAGWTERYSASVVIVCVGVNNFWNQADVNAAVNAELGAAEAAEPGTLARWFGKLRLVRFWRLMFYSRNMEIDGTGRPQIERSRLGALVEHRDPDSGDVLIRHERGTGAEEVYAGFRRDLDALRKQAERLGVKLIFLTYATVPERMSLGYGPHQAFNDRVRDFCKRHRLSLVDAEPHFRALMEAGSTRRDLFLSQHDGHPNARGYAEIADLVARQLLPE